MNSFGKHFQELVIDIESEVKFFQRTDEINEVYGALGTLDAQLAPTRRVAVPDYKGTGDKEVIDLDETLLPVVKRVLIYERRAVATDVEKSKEKTHNAQLLAILEKELKPFDELMLIDPIRNAKALKIPPLTDYLSTQVVDRIRKGVILEGREYDEKFHILQAPRLFIPDLRYY